MDSDRINAIAFSMGVKRSKILLPWEQPPLKDIFGCRSPLIPPAQWVPETGIAVESNDVDKIVSKGHLMGKTSWTTKTTVIPWPVFEEAKLSKVLELWRVVILDSYQHTALGRQIPDLMTAPEPSEEALKDVIKDALCGKSISTLRSRVASITTFGRWKKSVSLPEEVSIFPITETMAYRYICELRKEGAPRSRATRFLESVGFCKGMLGAEVSEVLASARVKGACISRLNDLEPRKKDPLTVDQVAFLELLASTRHDHVGIFAGYMCFLIFGRLRWSDGQYCKEEPWIDEGHEFSYLEARLYHHKTAGRAKVGKRLLPVACPVPGVSRHDWAVSWLYHRELHGLCAGVGKPTMPAPVHGGGWSSLPLSSSDAAMWLREVLSGQGLLEQSQSIGTHSAKATALSWMCKAHAPGDIQRLAGYHVDPSSKSALEYSRDSQAPVLHFMEGMILAIFSELFLPDSTRAGRWVGCRSLEQALAILSKRKGQTPVGEEWQTVPIFGSERLDNFEGSGAEEDNASAPTQRPVDLEEQSDGSEDNEDGFELPSSASEAPSGDDQEEDERQLEVTGKAVSGLVASAGLQRNKVFRHKVSGIYHLMADVQTGPDEDGEMSSTKCGKLISQNFDEVDSHESFLPTKCKKCFTQ
jgi:hypothetical protein